ncbi:MAG: DUF3015 domain-containing protein, partial [Deltaproteobacteria bacterium]|nr:DUF3015 domain-containing protein [Deltaproteobacteria bacterium]
MKKAIIGFCGMALLAGLGAAPAWAKCKLEDFVDSKGPGGDPRGAVLYTTFGYPSSTSTYGFAQSSGTSGCGKDGGSDDNKITALEQQVEFVKYSTKLLLEDFSRGGGEYADSLAGLLGCSPELRGRFAGLMQSRLEVLQPDAVLP